MNARTLRNLAAAMTIPMLPSTALAQGDAFTLEAAPEKEPEVIYVNEIELGAGYTNIDSFKFGEYTGIEDDGVFPIVNILLMQRPAWDSDETPRYWLLEGSNLGIESRSVYGEYGVQGNYETFIEYQQIPRNQFNDGRTPYIGAGGTSLSLPTPWTAAGTPSGMTQLLPSLRGIEVETERQNVGAGFLKHLDPRWKIGVDFHHDTKEGIDTIGGSFAGYGGNPKAVILPEPIDYETNRVNFFAEYVNKTSMFRFDYEFSAFNNRKSSLTFQNPYTAQGGFVPWDPAAAHPTGFGRFALEPDNLAHSFSLSAARTLGKTSRISGRLTHTRYEQDENFQPYTVNPALAAPIPLPRNSLDGLIATTIFDLGYTSRPLQKLDVAARYRFEYRDNDTPTDTFVYVLADTIDQGGAGSSFARINLPYGSGNTHKVKLDGGYRVIPNTKVSLGYQFEQKKRKVSEVNTLREHTVSGKVSSSPFESASGWVRYAHSFRNGSTYRDNLLYLESHPNSTSGFENDPRLRKYFIADRDRDEVRAVVHYMPSPRYTVTLDGAFSIDDYDETEIGLTEVQMASITLDFTVNPQDDITANFFATYENAKFDQDGCSWNSGNTDCVDVPPGPTATARSWTTTMDDRIFTLGLGAKWQINSRLGIGTDLSFSRALTQVETTSPGLTTEPLPDVVSHWYSLGAHANYKLKKNLEARLSYAYEHLETDDFSVDGLGVDTLNDVITLGEASPNYRGHIIGLALSYKF